MTSEVTTSIGLMKRFGERLATDGVDLHGPTGIGSYFVGSNGAGKTTTVRMLLGLIRPNFRSAYSVSTRSEM
ncbi:MAG TPA: hypothetical protein VMV22_11500 [Acidimicrobiales bacterium]|nr:hypothetical protein [Acidimicrobiales bacterium]